MSEHNLNIPLLIHRAEIEEGRAKGVSLDGEGDTLFIVRTHGQLHAWRNSCPHQPGAPMAWRRDGYMSSDGTLIICHVHGARFEPHSGLCIHGPCRGKRLERVDLSEGADGQLFIR